MSIVRPLAPPVEPSLPSVLHGVGLRAVFQPVVDLDSNVVIGYEALARGPAGSAIESPQVLLDAAAEAGVLPEFDCRCRLAALTAANAGNYPTELLLFLNTEPASFTEPVPSDIWDAMQAAARGRSVVMEFTERDLVSNPRSVLEAADWARLAGMFIALDDVGAEPMSLAMLSILRPDVVKLDLRLLQNRNASSEPVANAVRAYAESTGAVVLAEGIETEEHLGVALSLGAVLGQGWLFGRPEPLPVELPAGTPVLTHRPAAVSTARSPFDVALEGGRVPRQATRRNLLPLSMSLEHAAEKEDIPPLLLASFQDARRFTPGTALRYRRLAETCPLVAVFGVGMTANPAEGVRGIAISPSDAFAEEWTVLVVGAHHAAALIARPLAGSTGAGADELFEYIVTHDRDVVSAAAKHSLRRIGKAG